MSEPTQDQAADELQRQADEYQRDAIAGAQSESNEEAMLQKYQGSAATR